ncbi:MAG TPA: ABC transporter ATP-binding protein, partial [Spirochaetales bacterium]|nr:ABC transporter ATP-binding protein [Spirochaetales bacterium]
GVSVPGIAPQEKTIAIDIATIDFNEVSFTYPGRVEKALDGVSFRVTKGERLGVIGPVGSGKSTLIKVLLGLLPPDSGMVKINGVPLDAIDTETYAKKIGYVPQEALLFSGTLKENIDFFIDEPNDTVFNQALRISQMSDEVANFTDRELTVVGQRGLSLSGGQKQRMAIARAIARKPELMVFDDITASLDAANEERLMNELNAFAQNLTFIIVSHRLSTLQYVDKILFLDRGKVVGFGTHEELMLLPAYAAFIREHFLEQN